MGYKKITELPLLDNIMSGAIAVLVQEGITYQVPAQLLTGSSRNLLLRRTLSTIDYKYEGDLSWQMLIPLEDLMGRYLVEMDVTSAGRVMVRYSDSGWIDIGGLPEPGLAFPTVIVFPNWNNDMTLSAAHSGSFFVFDKASTMVCYIPNYTGMNPWKIGVEITLYVKNDCVLSILPSDSAEIIPPFNGTLTMTQGMAATLKCIGLDSWLILGQTVGA